MTAPFILRRSMCRSDMQLCTEIDGWWNRLTRWWLMWRMTGEGLPLF